MKGPQSGRPRLQVRLIAARSCQPALPSRVMKPFRLQSSIQHLCLTSTSNSLLRVPTSSVSLRHPLCSRLNTLFLPSCVHPNLEWCGAPGCITLSSGAGEDLVARLCAWGGCHVPLSCSTAIPGCAAGSPSFPTHCCCTCTPRPLTCPVYCCLRVACEPQ